MLESPIFVKSFDVLTWLLNHTKSWRLHARSSSALEHRRGRRLVGELART